MRDDGTAPERQASPGLAERIRLAFASPPREPLFSGDDIGGGSGPPTPAAVLIAITDRAVPGVVLTVRRDDMRTHAGQVAFPGGRLDSGEDATTAALREAWEELGLDTQLVEPVAAMEPYLTITGYSVTPVIGVIPPDLPLSPHEDEVADWFEAPLSYLLDPSRQKLQSVLFEGRKRPYYRIDWNGRNIWGATAAMLVNLSRRLQWS